MRSRCKVLLDVFAVSTAALSTTVAFTGIALASGKILFGASIGAAFSALLSLLNHIPQKQEHHEREVASTK